jgi:neutral amino acid transport system substrate-binding protein
MINIFQKSQPRLAAVLALYLSLGGILTSCGEPMSTTNTTNPNTPTASGGDGKGGLKLGTLLSSTGDVASIAQPLPIAVKMAVDEVNKCGGVNGANVELVSEDDQSDPSAGTAAMVKLTEANKVAGVVGSFASSVSTAAAAVAVKNKAMLVSPGSTSPEFTKRALKGEYQGFWARTAPPDTYQGQAMAQLAIKKGFKKVATIAINNDYGKGFEQEFVQAFKKLGGTVVNEAKPTRYDPKATTFDTEVKAAFSNQPQAMAAIVYPDTGSLLLKAAYEQGVSKGVTVMLPDGAYSPKFPDQVGKTTDGKFIIDGAIGTVPGAHGKALEAFNTKWKGTQGDKPLTAYLQHSWDAAALLMLAAQASGQNTGEGIKGKIREVSGGEGSGQEVSDVCEGLKLLKEGKKINYQGASGNVDIDPQGDVIGAYDIWQVQPDGTLKTIDKVEIAGGAKPAAGKTDAKPDPKTDGKAPASGTPKPAEKAPEKPKS